MVGDVETIEVVDGTTEEGVDMIMVLDHIDLKVIKAQLSKYPKPKILTLFAINVVLKVIGVIPIVRLNIWLIFIIKSERLKEGSSFC